MDIYKAKIQSVGIIYKLKLITVVRRDFINKEIIGGTWDQSESTRNLKYL